MVELREKVGAAPAGDPIVVMRGSDPRLLARDGLVGLGFSPAEAERCSTARRARRRRTSSPTRSRARAGDASAPRAADRVQAPQAARRGRAGRDAAPAPPRRLRRPGGAEGAARRLHRRGGRPRRGARPRAAGRPAGPGQDEPGAHRGRGARRRLRADRRPGARAQGRHRGLPHRPRAARGLLRGRDPPAPARGGGDLLPGHGGPPAPGHARRRARAPAWSRSTCRRSRWSAPRRAPACSPPRCATASASSTAWTTTPPASSRASSSAPPPCSAWRWTPPGRGRSPTARAARRAWPTACSSACATSRRCAATAPIDGTVAVAALDLLEVDHAGLDRLDRELLSTICSRFSGGPVGLSTLAVAVGEEADTVEDVYEPYLLQRGFLQRTPRGRCATPHAFRHLGLPPPAEQPVLF